MSEEATLQIRSYGVCFDLERRIHKIDRWQIPLPYGLPIRGLAYFGALLATVLLLERLPLAGMLLDGLHPALRYLVVPVAAAAALTQLQVDGRPAHAVAVAWVRMQLEPQRISAFRRLPAPGPVRLASVTFVPDERSVRLRQGVVEGPGAAILRYPVQMEQQGRTLHVSQTAAEPLWRGKQVNLRAGQRLVLR